MGVLQVANPLDACADIDPPRMNGTSSIALIKRGGTTPCEFGRKVGGKAERLIAPLNFLLAFREMKGTKKLALEMVALHLVLCCLAVGLFFSSSLRGIIKLTLFSFSLHHRSDFQRSSSRLYCSDCLR
jgi:hypothetical protein